MKLTVIFRDDAPLMHAGDCPSYRRVTIDLTEEQCKALMPKQQGVVGGQPLFEAVSRCLLEIEETP